MRLEEYTTFSEMFEREMKDPEFRAGYEALEAEDRIIRAKIDAKIKAKKLKEERAKGKNIAQTQFAS
jgi:hypothetical protein